MVRNRTTRRFNLPCRQPHRLERLQPKVAEVDDATALRNAAHAAAMLLTVLDAPRLKHP
jgi:hypothetical protein